MRRYAPSLSSASQAIRPLGKSIHTFLAWEQEMDKHPETGTPLLWQCHHGIASRTVHVDIDCRAVGHSNLLIVRWISQHLSLATDTGIVHNMAFEHPARDLVIEKLKEKILARNTCLPAKYRALFGLRNLKGPEAEQAIICGMSVICNLPVEVLRVLHNLRPCSP
jgi:hypothetical protein